MKFLQLIQSEQEAVKQPYEVIYYDESKSGIFFVSNKVTVTFKDWDDTVISTTKYVYGDTIVPPSNPTREGYTFLSWDNTVSTTATADTTYKAQYYVNPSVTITMNDSYTDTSLIVLSASKNESVKDGSLVFTMDLSNDIAEISDGFITFKKHYEGDIVITATAEDKYNENHTVSDTKIITVDCEVADEITYSVIDIVSPSVNWSDTSATVTYKCVVTTTKHSGESQSITGNTIEKVITFDMNLTDSAVTINGSFECEHGDTVEYNIEQGAYHTTTIWYNGDEIIEELDVVGELTYSYRVTACTRCEIGTHVTSIGNKVFRNYRSLTSVTIPNSVTSIGDGAFYNCSSLTSVTIPDSVTNIGSDAFYNIGMDVLYSDNGKFLCHVSTATTSFDIAEGTETIVGGAFYNCSSLSSVTIPSSVTYIGDGAFDGCLSLTSVIIPNSVTSIGYNAFFNCTSLISVTIPSSVTYIGDGAFGGCSSLTSVTIPSSVTYIGDGAFDACSSLTSVTYNGTIVQWRAITKGYSWKEYVPSECTVHCTDGDINIADA